MPCPCSDVVKRAFQCVGDFLLVKAQAILKDLQSQNCASVPTHSKAKNPRISIFNESFDLFWDKWSTLFNYSVRVVPVRGLSKRGPQVKCVTRKVDHIIPIHFRWAEYVSEN